MRALLLDSVPLSFGGGYERFLLQIAEYLRSGGDVSTIVTPRRAVLTKTKVVMPGRAGGPEVVLAQTLSGWRSLRAGMAGSDVLYLKNEPHELMGIFSLKRRPPVVVGLHSAMTKGAARTDLASRVYRSRAYGSLLRQADHVHALQQEQADWCVNEHHLDSSRISVIPNGVDLEQFRPGPSRRGTCRLLFVGRLDQHKGVDVLISAVRQVVQTGGSAGATLTIAGDGPLMADVKQLALDVPQIEVLGYVKDVAMLMQEHDVLLVPSRWEAMALVPLEGLASGLPLIVSDIAAFRQISGPAVTWANVGDAHSLAQALTAVISEHRRSPAAWAEQSTAARSLATSQFGSESSLAELAALLRRCAAGRA